MMGVLFDRIIYLRVVNNHGKSNCVWSKQRLLSRVQSWDMLGVREIVKLKKMNVTETVRLTQVNIRESVVSLQLNVIDAVRFTKVCETETLKFMVNIL